jgi:hypothetical protein
VWYETPRHATQRNGFLLQPTHEQLDVDLRTVNKYA